MAFYESFVRLCNAAGKSPSAVAIEMGIEKSTVGRWRRGSMPTDATKIKVADYFGIAVSELMAENEEKPVQLDGLTEEEALFITRLRSASVDIRKAVKAVLDSAENK